MDDCRRFKVETCLIWTAGAWRDPVLQDPHACAERLLKSDFFFSLLAMDPLWNKERICSIAYILHFITVRGMLQQESWRTRGFGHRWRVYWYCNSFGKVSLSKGLVINRFHCVEFEVLSVASSGCGLQQREEDGWALTEVVRRRQKWNNVRKIITGKDAFISV